MDREANAMSVYIDSDVLGDLTHYFDRFPERAQKAASKAINQVARRSGRKRITDAIYAQVAFPQGYLDAPGRLDNRKFATPADLEAIITARQRATSLARFLAPGQSFATGHVSGKVRVRVTPGKEETLDRAFLIRLNAGDQNTETVHNIGLAVRVPRGQTLRGGKGLRLDKGSNAKTDLYLLYTVSVDQIFRRIADEQLDQIGNDVSNEFMRQFDLDL
jgi:hypothetical protein